MAHPSQFRDWEWDEGNERELSRLHIMPDEVEEVADDEPRWASNRRGRSGRWLMVGRTYGGRALTVVVIFDEESLVARAITGWDSTAGEHSRYLRRRRP